MKGKIMLLGERNFLADAGKKINTEFGVIDLRGVKYGQVVKSSSGAKFVAVRPTIKDLLSKCKRIPQIVTQKDAAQIVAVTGLRSGWKCLDLGSGSGFLSIFIGNIVAPSGSVTTYEKDSAYIKNIRSNVEFCGLEDVVAVKNAPAEKFTERGLDLITIDMTGAEKLVKKCHSALKRGGWLVVYSPHIEQQQKVRREVQKLGFSFVRTIETIQREWKVDPRGFSHPMHSQLAHTGFMTFARKI